MNEVWAELLPPCIRPFVCSFREVPAGKKHGFLKIISGVRDLEEIELGGFADIVDHENFIRTSCGWIIAAYVLGLSDRHRENTIVRLADSSAIPIDFGFMLGNEPPGANTYAITISTEFYEYLLARNAWPRFATMFLGGFWSLRLSGTVFVTLAVSLFSGTSRDPRVLKAFIATRLMSGVEHVGMSDSEALPAIIKMLRHAPRCHETRKKINGHAKNKLFLQKHGGNFFVGLVIKRAVESKPRVDTESAFSFHTGRVPLEFPPLDAFPEPLPIPFSSYITSLRASKNLSCTLAQSLSNPSLAVIPEEDDGPVITEIPASASESRLAIFKTPALPGMKKFTKFFSRKERE